MASKNQNGFTLIELILFLALSAFFLMIALTGIRGRTAAVQRTDAVRSFASFLEGQRTEIYNGVNIMGDGKSGDTIVLGRTFVLQPGSSDILVYTIVGERNDFDPDKSARELIAEANPVSVGDPFVYELEWGMNFREAFNLNSNDPIEMFSLLRNPYGQGLVSLAYAEDEGEAPPRPGESDESDLYKLGKPWTPGSVSIHLCLESADGMTVEVTVGSGRRDLGVNTLFEDRLDECSG